MSVTLTQVLSKIGDENIQLQFINQSLLDFKETKHDLEIKFATCKSNKPLENNRNMGIVIWVDKETYQEAVDSLSNKET